MSDRSADDRLAGDVTYGGRASVRDLLVDAERRLVAVGVGSPGVDAAEIVAYALGTTRSRLFLQDEVTPDQRVRVEQLLTKRLSRVPLQHLLGSAGFRRIELQVGPGVFTPRPETELVAEAAIRELADQPVGQRIGVDLCTGSGAIAISMGMEVPGARVHAVELSEEAVEWARRNAAAFEDALSANGSRVDIVHADAGEVAEPGQLLSRLAGQVAVVVSNPPYIPADMVPRDPEVRDHEPGMALYGGGDDGLTVIRAVLRTAAVLLKPGGLLVIEHADVQGAAAGDRGVPGTAARMLADADLSLAAGIPAGHPVWTSIDDRPDLNRLPRFTLARKAS